LNHCVRPVGAVLSRDLSDHVLSSVEKTPTKPHSGRIFKSTIDLQIRLSSKFVENLETHLPRRT
jgi:hypothetical protein